MGASKIQKARQKLEKRLNDARIRNGGNLPSRMSKLTFAQVVVLLDEARAMPVHGAYTRRINELARLTNTKPKTLKARYMTVKKAAKETVPATAPLTGTELFILLGVCAAMSMLQDEPDPEDIMRVALTLGAHITFKQAVYFMAKNKRYNALFNTGRSKKLSAARNQHARTKESLDVFIEEYAAM
jgi:hypothetical protein